MRYSLTVPGKNNSFFTMIAEKPSEILEDVMPVG